MIISIVLAVHKYNVDIHKELLKTYDYQLNPNKESKNSNSFFDVSLRVGKTVCTIKSVNLLEGREINPLSHVVNFDYPISLKVKNNKLLFSGKITSFELNQIAEIIDNEWSVKESEVFDRNFNESILEVIDKKYGIPLFKIEMQNPTDFKITGALINENQILVASDSNWVIRGFPMPANEIKESCKNLKRYFKYPSNLHLGELANYSTLINYKTYE